MSPDRPLRVAVQDRDSALRYYWRNPEARKAEFAARRAADPEKYRQIARESAKRLRREKPASAMLAAARARARARGLDFDLSVEDIRIPLKCPVLGIALEAHNPERKDHAPTLDRIDNEKGYVRGNVQVISYRANRLKSDAEPWEMAAIARYMKRGGCRQRPPHLT